MTVTQAYTTNCPPKRNIDYIKKDFSVQEELMCVFDPWHYQAIRKIVRFEAPYHLLEGDRKIPDEITVFVTLEEWDGIWNIMRTPAPSMKRTTVSLPITSALSKKPPRH